MTQPIAITGLGALSTFGSGIAETCTMGARATAEGLDTTRFVSERLKRKLDRFTVLGLCAAGLALEESGLLASGIAPERIGIFVGNCLGGWSFAEPELRRLHTGGVGAMGPYVATAWFPAAVQGQVSLAHGIKGYSKTFSGDVGGLAAIGHAMRAIRSGRIDAAICGAAESLDSAYVRAVLAPEPDSAFVEGAAFLTLERHDRARARGAPVHAAIAGYSERFAPQPDDLPRQADRTIREATPDGDALVIACGDSDAAAPRVSSRFGRMFALSGVLEAACAAYRLRHGRLCAADFGAAGAERFDHAVVHLAGRSGAVASLGISRAGQSLRKEQANG